MPDGELLNPEYMNMLAVKTLKLQGLYTRLVDCMGKALNTPFHVWTNLHSVDKTPHLKDVARLAGSHDPAPVGWQSGLEDRSLYTSSPYIPPPSPLLIGYIFSPATQSLSLEAVAVLLDALKTPGKAAQFN